ncbi:hydrogenase 3 maturation endopeptidase HyCI [Methanogenium organophilum]|uniref:Hydrogenase 3 maturation endopeptidase HyCI n=1 Tax=Methanogenium organophilum TaxID=2199 RepID=A0A9X9S4Q7_METOG|nr:hydrogenase 3 maturation endopeptidase HyCI [Methanogenium organophilum]WAI01462.1 hydrogenase 3 maturation endopeptidase HyCI [Methanogenium organophilum]
MKLLLGVGNTMLGDDGIGPWMAERIKNCPGWHAEDCGTAPENFTGVVRKMQPRLLVIVDAADMRLTPGEFRKILPDSVGQAGFDTHSLPLTHIIGYLRENMPEMPEILLIGIQPGPVTFTDVVSAPVIRGGEEVAEMLCNGKEAQIPEYIPKQEE